MAVHHLILSYLRHEDIFIKIMHKIRTSILVNVTRRVILQSTLLLVSFTSYSQPGADADSITISIAPEYDQVTNTHRFLFGESYRKLWATPVKLKVLKLQKERGGLKILQRGGGMQTRSLRLQDSAGKEWVLRTIQKYPERGMPQNLRETVARDILQDQVSSSHPFAALTVPPFAQALEIPHSNPQIVYIADDPGLGEFRKEFANYPYLFEEREPLKAEDTDNTEKVQSELKEDNDNSVNQRLVLRARLLDMLLGDWDRHEDQWRWLQEKEKEKKIYTPIPRDRDDVYYKTSGLFPWIVSHQWLKSKFQGYGTEIRDVKGWNFNARYFDRYFLTELSEKDWKTEIVLVQTRITDDLIHNAMKLMPPAIYSLSGEEIAQKLKVRRSKLSEQALEYFRFISKTVDIPTSDKAEHFELTYQEQGLITINIRNIKKDGSKGRSLFRRTFSPDITEEIRLYGFGGRNIFSLHGSAKSPIRVYLVGGEDTDTYNISGDLHNKNKVFVYDSPVPKNQLPEGSEARLRISADTSVHTHDKFSFKYNRSGPLFMLNYDLDQGILLRAGFISKRQGFRKDPYASKHEFWANYSTGRKSFIFDYEGIFKKSIGNNDLSISLLSLGPRNISNFFGIGNETIFINDGDQRIDYYRNRYDFIQGDIRLHRQLRKSLRVNAGLGAEFYTSEALNNTSRFLKNYDNLNPQENVFDDRFFAGVVAGAVLDTRTRALLPSGGVLWTTQIRAMKQTNGEKDTYGKVLSELTFYVPLLRDSNYVMANRLGGGTTLGNPAFFQQMQLGGDRNLRGFRTNRFTGQSVLYHNLEIRAKLLDFTSYILPGSIGLIGFNDIGRVWVPHERSRQWHHGYGAGLYIVPAELILIQGVIGHSKEGTQPYISFGLRF